MKLKNLNKILDFSNRLKFLKFYKIFIIELNIGFSIIIRRWSIQLKNFYSQKYKLSKTSQ